MTSTAALAAERLASELDRARRRLHQPTRTAGLHAAITSGRVQLTADTTVIHDEAALASTREQLQLLRAVEKSGARLIEVGDPRQNQPVGAGGLWNHIERRHPRRRRARRADPQPARARPADRRDQARFREGEIELAIRGYASRDRVHLDTDQRRVEDRALDAAHRDRAAGKTYDRDRPDL